MRRIITALGIGMLATALTAGVAGAAPAPRTPTADRTHTAVTQNERQWYALAGVTRTESGAKELMARLEAKRFEGFQTRTREVRHGLHHVRRIEVERMFPDRRAAEAEAKQLREAGFRGRVAHQRG
jgi:Spy/CpxP family protein refolding chaperone